MIKNLNHPGFIKYFKTFSWATIVNIQEQLIRVGSEYDGGYVIPNDFENIKYCFSPGVGGKNDFDVEIANKGIEVFMCDASVEDVPEKHSKIHFEKKFLGSKLK